MVNFMTIPQKPGRFYAEYRPGVLVQALEIAPFDALMQRGGKRRISHPFPRFSSGSSQPLSMPLPMM
jgi:hypothetical protein